MPSDRRVVAVTGAAGFIGRNFALRLCEQGHEVRTLVRGNTLQDMETALRGAGTVFHLAGAVRPRDPGEFAQSIAFTEALAEQIAKAGQCPLVVYSSSRKADEQTRFGEATRACEAALLRLGERGEATIAVYRLPNVFGKWARPDYNSCVATFCHNLARGLPIRIDDADAPLSLLYVDDLIEQWCGLLAQPPTESGFVEASSLHETSVGEVAAILTAFAEERRTGRVGDVGAGLSRALYATFIAALPAEAFSYELAAHSDPRGSFTEILKTRAGGQVSVLTAGPGVTRGGHYHHTKIEKFVVVHGEGRFRFRHILSGECFEMTATAARPMVVETIPGWTHDITNIGDDMLVSLLWASEIFDPSRPDTVLMPL
jgi:UDP-2-acetamido-2,6-beta-L-arabino-hexul-4-ose reductase